MTLDVTTPGVWPPGIQTCVSRSERHLCDPGRDSPRCTEHVFSASNPDLSGNYTSGVVPPDPSSRLSSPPLDPRASSACPGFMNGLWVPLHVTPSVTWKQHMESQPSDSTKQKILKALKGLREGWPPPSASTHVAAVGRLPELTPALVCSGDPTRPPVVPSGISCRPDPSISPGQGAVGSGLLPASPACPLPRSGGL